MPEKKLKLYVWEDVLADYSFGIAFAMAHDVREAKRLLIAGGVPKDRWSGFLLDGVKAKYFDRPHANFVWGGG